MSSISLSTIASRVPTDDISRSLFRSETSRFGGVELSLEGHQAQSLLSVFDALAYGVLLLDFSGKVDRLNRSAKSHLDRSLVLVRSRLRAQVRDVDVALQRLIGSALRPGPWAPEQAVMAVPRPERRPLMIHAARFAPADELSSPAALVLVDLDKPHQPSEWTLRKAFGLTASEARLALAIADGHDVKTVAAAYNVSKGTVRSQLKAVFAKTGTHRQAELTGLLGRLAMF